MPHDSGQDCLTLATEFWQPKLLRRTGTLVVVEESAKGDPTAAQMRLAALGPLDLIPITGEMQVFAQELISAGAIPPTEPEDALHIALATLSGAKYLVSWNFAHLVGPERKIKLLDTIRTLGKAPALLTTPEELMEILP